jgi:phosphoribosylformylglycinamidine cyclo-ligase
VSGGAGAQGASERERASVAPATEDPYRRAGVDLDAAAETVRRIREVAAAASRAEVAESVGGFSGLFEIGEDRYLAAATDGVGTKLEVARLAGRLDTVGIDLVAMCADDVVCSGAEPLFFLDYLAVGRLVPDEVAAIVAGVAEGCRRAGCALLGGETAEHPGVMEAGRFDLAGFCVGVVEREHRLGPERVSPGDRLIGLASSGLHANGYSLVRSALLDRAGYALEDDLPRLGRTLGDELLEPTAIYAPLVRSLAVDGLVHAAAHVTGGGIVENVPRALPDGLGAAVVADAWPVPPIFELVAEAAGAPIEDLRSVLNLGLGMVLVVGAAVAPEVIRRAGEAGVTTFDIGAVEVGAGVRFS